MIWYNSQNTWTLIKWRGSVLPRSMLWALPSAILGWLLHFLGDEGYVGLDVLNTLGQNGKDVYSGFTFVLAFSLVFRTSQSYLRYWTAATSVHEMSCEWSDACAGLIAFTTISEAAEAEIARFRHTVVRLFSLLHAMALTEVADIDEELPLLDIEGLSKDELMILTQGHAQGKKVQIVLSWIKGYIIQMGNIGLLNVPAPILTRVYQELQGGLVNYHKALQIVIWPFPFPITQLNFVLIIVYTLVTPLVVKNWTSEAWLTVTFTLVSVTCMVGLEFIASELENPFGNDANDLPVLEMQRDMNKFLTMQLNPMTHRTPELAPKATTDLKKLILQCKASTSPTIRSGSTQSALGASLTLFSRVSRQKSTRLTIQTRWRGAVTPTEDNQKMREWLRTETHLSEEDSCMESSDMRSFTRQTMSFEGDTGPTWGERTSHRGGLMWDERLSGGTTASRTSRRGSKRSRAPSLAPSVFMDTQHEDWYVDRHPDRRATGDALRDWTHAVNLVTEKLLQHVDEQKDRGLGGIVSPCSRTPRHVFAACERDGVDFAEQSDESSLTDGDPDSSKFERIDSGSDNGQWQEHSPMPLPPPLPSPMLLSLHEEKTGAALVGAMKAARAQRICGSPSSPPVLTA